MIIEFIIGAAFFGFGNLIAGSENRRFPRPTYNALVGWWYGAFVPETATIQLANMIDSDQACELWGRREGNDWYDGKDYIELTSKMLKARVRIRGRGFCYAWIEDKDGRENKLAVSRYEDAILASAINRWEKRRKFIKKMEAIDESTSLIQERVTKGYIDMVDMVEKRILKSEANTAGQLTALLETPKPKKAKVQHGIMDHSE